MGRRLSLLVALGASWLLACGLDPEDGEEILCPDGACAEGDAGGDDGASDDDDDASDDDDDDASDDDDDDDTSDGDGVGIPCEVRDALAAACDECHSAMPAFGAPMPLASFDDFQVPAATDATRAVFEVAQERIDDVASPMPPGGEMDPAHRAALTAWLADGAPEDAAADCGDTGDVPDPDPSGPEALPCEPDTVFAAHGPGGGKFTVPEVGADDLYQCFAFQSPFSPTTQATAWAPIIDDERVVHHWILYSTNQPQNHGAAYPCDVTLQLNANFVAGWAPGGENTVLPDDVGLELGGSDTWYILQVHYNNSANYPDAADNSGVAFCTTDTPRANEAGILTLGTININVPPGAVGHETTGSCASHQTSQWPPVHVVATSPHMHEFGRAFRTEIVRAGGGTEMMTDIPNFDFANQLNYLADPEIIINPGDALYSTCTFDNPTAQTVTFGEGTGDEMCFNFSLVYPIDQIPNRNCGISIFG